MAEHSYGRVLSDLARAEPERVALVVEDDAITRGALEARANALAHAYAARGVGHGDIVSLCLPNGIELVAATFATWKLGAVPNPLSERLTAHERNAILDRADPKLVLGIDSAEVAGRAALPAGFEPADETAPPPDRTPPHERALASGGSSGLPKLIIPKSPASYDPENASPFFRVRQAALVPGPIHHAAPFSATFQAMLAGCKVVLMRRFDPSRFLELIEAHRVDRVTLVPTMMLRIWRLPERERLGRDLSSLECVMSGGAPLPAWLMRAWIDWLGPDVMCEAYGPSERIGGTFITGREWLEHPGSVGRPTQGGRIRILGEDGRILPAGEMGEIFMMPAGGPGSTYRYVGAEGRRSEDGWESVGDMGSLDEDGFLFLGDRRSDMIVTGGRNVYPAEVEAAIEAHPGVLSCAVIGLPDEDLGQRIHAIVELEGELDAESLRQVVADRLSAYKVPRSFELSDQPLRDDAGKVRREALSNERAHGGS